MAADADDIIRAVKDADFPADKDELLATARRSGASDQAVKALRGIPPERYANRQEVVRSVRLPADTDVDRTPGERGEQAGKGGRRGLSQHLREVDRPPLDDEER
jgi:hypothetical protein